MLFQSTHSLRSATRQPRICRVDENVSIHALLAECDRKPPLLRRRLKSFNPRTPCGVRLANLAHISLHDRFQSTHSLRSATIGVDTGESVEDVSIHALLAECDFVVNTCATKTRSFNPRTPCGVRPWVTALVEAQSLFQSTHSLRSATSIEAIANQILTVSIHALLAECDCA